MKSNLNFVVWIRFPEFSVLDWEVLMHIDPCVAPLDIRPLRPTRISESHARYRLHQSQQLEARHWAAWEGQTTEPGALTKSQLELHHVSESEELCGWVNACMNDLTRQWTCSGSLGALGFSSGGFLGFKVFNLFVQLKTAKTEEEFSLSSLGRKNDECCCDKWR